MEKSLIDLKKGEQAEVISIEGGHILNKRLEALGIRPGKIVCRISSQPMGGPVIILVDGRQTALGRGMATMLNVRTIRNA